MKYSASRAGIRKLVGLPADVGASELCPVDIQQLSSPNADAAPASCSVGPSHQALAAEHAELSFPEHSAQVHTLSRPNLEQHVAGSSIQAELFQACFDFHWQPASHERPEVGRLACAFPAAHWTLQRPSNDLSSISTVSESSQQLIDQRAGL